MQPNKTHRYLVSFVRTGLVSQRQSSGEYELGPTLRVLGLTAFRLTDPYQRLFEGLRALREELQTTTLLAVWTEAGATIIGWENGIHHTSISFRLGSTLPLTYSATGRVFLAHLAPASTKGVLKRELSLDGPRSGRQPIISDELAKIRDQGYAHSSDEILPDVDAYSAPIFDDTGDIFAVLTALAPHRYMQGRVAERARFRILETTLAASAELGFRPKTLPP